MRKLIAAAVAAVCAGAAFAKDVDVRAAPLEDIVFRNCSFTRARAEAFPLKWRQVGAAYWWNAQDEVFTGVKGVRFDGCTFEEEMK